MKSARLADSRRDADDVGPAGRPEGYRALLDNLHEVVFETDVEGRWTFLNRAWQDVTGLVVTETLGRSWLEFIGPEDAARAREVLRSLVDRRTSSCTDQLRCRVGGGALRWFEVTARPLIGENGFVTGVCGLLSDITSRRTEAEELSQARQRLDFVQASSPATLFSADPEPPHTPNFVTSNVRTLLGYEPEDMMARPGFWMEILHPEDVPIVAAVDAVLFREGRATFRARSRHRDGTYRMLRTDVRLTRNEKGAPQEIFGCLVDETDAWKAEAALGRYARILETTSLAAKGFLEPGSWEEKIGGVMETLGEASAVSRIRVFERPAPEVREPVSRYWKWIGTGGQGRTGRPALGITPYLDWKNRDLVRRLSSGEEIRGLIRDLPEPLRSRLVPEQVQSLLLLPVFAGKQLWGAIAFEDCSIEREWPAAEVGALRAAAGVLGGTIHREVAERTLRYSEALLRTMANASPLAFYVVDNRSDRVLYFNDRFCWIWGLEDLSDRLAAGELTNTDVMAACIPTVADPQSFAAMCIPLQDEQNRSVVEDEIRLRDGRTIQRYSTQIRDVEDQYFGRLYLFADISAPKRAEEALRRAHDDLEMRVRERTAELEKANSSLRVEISERERAESELAQMYMRFRALIDNTQDIIFVTDTEGIIRYASPSVERVLGYDSGEVIGRNGFELMHPEDRPIASEHQQRLLRMHGTHQPMECRMAHKNGSWRLVQVIGSNQIDNPAVRGLIATVHDITEQRGVEQQFRQAQKMEAVGRLAGGVAHDFNNLLTVIRGYSGLIMKRLPEEDPSRRNMAQIQRAADRAATLVQQLLAFSRKQVVEPKVLDVNVAAAELEKMLHRLIGEDIELTIERSDQPLYVRIDPIQFEQIVMNLSVNARDAMPEGGSLKILAGRHSPRGDCKCQACKVNTGAWAVLAVRDTGVGISEEIRAHIFEPFFTTKEVGKGTGLGLSMVYGAVEQAGGHVCVDSAPGEGSTFRICLPIVAAPRDSEVEEGAAPHLTGGDETILVAEDEELVRMMMSEALREAGYHVLEAVSGVHALEILERWPGRVELLLTDVIMPRLNGPALAARVCASRPETRVLYVSGHPRQELNSDYRFLRKPFTPDELVREVRSALDAPAAPPPIVPEQPGEITSWRGYWGALRKVFTAETQRPQRKQ